MEDMFNQLMKSVEDKKESILKERCEELGLPLPDFSLKEQRFNPYLVERHQGFGELYYYNDGSKNGKFIVGFTDFKEPDYFSDSPIKIEWDVVREEPEWNKKSNTD